MAFWLPSPHPALVRPKTEELLNFLLWSAQCLLHPTFRNLTGSYESWAYRNGLTRQVNTLEKQQFLERDANASNHRVFRLTAQGRLHALGGRDPQERWRRPWDGQWSLVLFDLPTTQNTQRDRLRRYLRDRGFGYLQDSAWITPDPLTDEGEILVGGEARVESLILLRARPCAGESDADIVAGAWDFDRINQRYAKLLRMLDRRPSAPLVTSAAAQALRQWASEERMAWLDAVTNDPLLPAKILPPDYLGQRAWQRRVQVLHDAACQLNTFRPTEPHEKPLSRVRQRSVR